MRSFRRIQLLKANKPRITSVAARIRVSLRVAHASTANAAYAIIAFAKRLITSDPANKIWCTGKDSNLRTSLGGTDLQSVGFNHSPTCADTAGRCSRCPSSFHPAGRSRKLRQHTSACGLPNSFYKLDFRKSEFRKSGKPRIAPTTYRAKITARRNRSEVFRMKCVGKTCCATYTVPLPAGN